MKHGMKFTRLIFILLIGLLPLPACGALAPASEPLPPLKIAYTQWWGDYTVLIAKEKGFFDKYNVGVEPVYYEVFSKAVPDLASGQIDGGTYIIGDMLNIAPHTDVTVVGISDDGGTTHIIGAPGITAPGDLRGKMIGVQIGSAYELLVLEMLKSASLTAQDVNLVNVDAEIVPQKISDGSIQAGLTWEPYTSDALGAGDHLLFSSEQITGLFADVIVLRTDLLKQRPEDVRNYLKAWFEAVEFRLAFPDEANKIIADKMGIPAEQITEDAKILSLKDNLDLYKAKPEFVPLSIYDLAQLNVDFYIRNGKLSIVPDLNQLFNPAYLGQ